MPRGRPKGSKNKKIEIGGHQDNIPMEEKIKEGINPTLRRVTNELSKQFGKEIIHFASEEPERERIPTGIFELDKMIKGFPSGAFSVIWGNKGSTKCVEGDTLIVTDKGLQKIKNLGYKKEGFTKKKINLITQIGKITTSHIFTQKVNKYIEIELSNGTIIKGTTNHPLLTSKGYISLSEIKKEDEVLLVGGLINFVNPETPYFNFKPNYSKTTSKKNKFIDFPKYMTKDLAFILGYHLGDGDHNNKQFRITFGDKQKMNSFIGKLRNVFGNKLLYNFCKTRNCYRLSSQNIIRDFCKYIGHNTECIETMEIPSIIFNCPKYITGAFIHGLLSSDGFVDKNGKVLITLNSKKIIYQLQQLLLYLGIRSNIRRKYNKTYDKYYYQLYIGPREEIKKLNDILFQKRTQLKGFGKKFQRLFKRNNEVYVTQNDVFIFSEKVISKYIHNEELKVYDVTVPNYHFFVGNGIINHNTTTALHLIAEAQKLGKTCLYLDLETSFDNSWADKCGIDRSKLLIGHFDNAEQALDTAIKMSKEKVIDVIILDSVQSLSPEGEQETKKGEEKSTGDDTMALLARRLSQFFRMDAAGNYKGNVTFILIGQSRMDLGGYIKLEKLSGGKALAHWATLIIKAYRATKADAPHYKFKIGDKTKSFPIGFEICYRLEKKKISGPAPEETEVRTNFYNEFGFRKPADKEIENLYADWIEMEKE